MRYAVVYGKHQPGILCRALSAVSLLQSVYVLHSYTRPCVPILLSRICLLTGRARSASVVSQARLGGGAIVHLPCTGHPTHSTPVDYGTGTDTGLQSYPLQDRLLQCCAARRSKLQHQEVAASTEHRSSDRSRSTKLWLS